MPAKFAAMAPDTATNRPDSLRAEVIDKIAALVTVAFGLVAALAWNSAIQALFAEFFGEASALTGMIIYAVSVTIIAVLATIWIGRVAGRIRARTIEPSRAPPRGPGRPMS